MKPSQRKKKTPSAPPQVPQPVAGARELLVGFSAPELSEVHEVENPEAASFQSNLISLLSHEIRTPLMGILNGALLLEMERPAEQRTEGERLALEQIQRNGARLQSLIQNLLDLAVLEAHALQPQLQEIPLASWLQEKLKTPVELGGSPSLASCHVLADPEKLYRALSAILDSLAKLQASEREFRLDRRTHPTLELWFTLPNEEVARQVDEVFKAASLLVSTGALDPTQALKFAFGGEAAFLRVQDDQSPLSSEVPWALALHSLGVQEIQVELLADSGAPLRRLLLFSFPRRESQYRVERLLHTRILQLEGHRGGSGRLVVAHLQSGAPDECLQVLKAEGLLEPHETALLSEETHSVLVILESPSDRRQSDFESWIAKNALLTGSGTAHYPQDAADARSLLELARARVKPNSIPSDS